MLVEDDVVGLAVANAVVRLVVVDVGDEVLVGDVVVGLVVEDRVLVVEVVVGLVEGVVVGLAVEDGLLVVEVRLLVEDVVL